MAHPASQKIPLRHPSRMHRALFPILLTVLLAHLSAASAQPATAATTDGDGAVSAHFAPRVNRTPQAVELVDSTTGVRLLSVEPPGDLGAFVRLKDVLYVVLRPRGVAVIDLHDAPTRLPDLARTLAIARIEVGQGCLILRPQNEATAWVYDVENPREPRFLELKASQAAILPGAAQAAPGSLRPVPNRRGMEILLAGLVIFGVSYLPLAAINLAVASGQSSSSRDYTISIPVGGALFAGGKAIGESGQSIYGGIGAALGLAAMVDGLAQLAGVVTMVAGAATWATSAPPKPSIALHSLAAPGSVGLGLSATF